MPKSHSNITWRKTSDHIEVPRHWGLSTIQAFKFRVGRATVCKIIYETCNAIWDALSEPFLKAPASSHEWKQIANGFGTEWNFPTCLGALDGKHIAMECPKNGGSNYYNYKGFHRYLWPFVIQTVVFQWWT